LRAACAAARRFSLIDPRRSALDNASGTRAQTASPMCFDDFDVYRPSAAWYAHDPYGMHGLGHAARVLVWTDVIGGWLHAHGQHVDLEVTRWSATLHELRRLDDGRDFGHGERAADWVNDNGTTVLT